MLRSRPCYLFGFVLTGIAYGQPAVADILLGSPTRLASPVNSNLRDESAVLSADGLTMYFSSTRSGGRGLFEAKRESLDSPWESVQRVEGINRPVTASTISPDGLELYFADGWSPFFGGDLWMSRRTSVDAPWSTPERLPETINSRAQDDGPFLSPDGLSLYFGSNRSGGFGGNDIYVAKRATVNDAWEPPVNLGPAINSPSNDWMGGVSADGLSMFYDSTRPQGVGSYLARRSSLEGEFDNPAFFPPSVNVSAEAWRMTASPDGSTLYYSVGHNDAVDIWEVSVTPFESVSIDGNEGTYLQSFDEALGVDGSGRGTSFPAGWTTSANGVIHEKEIMQSFPVRSSISPLRTPTLNAGAENDTDRALAIGVVDDDDQRMLQLLAEVTDSDATGVRLKFDIEAWDARRSRPDDPGEAAFDVSVDVNRGDGFMPLLDFGRVTSGATLSPPDGDYLNGNDDANRVVFDSGMRAVSVPVGSQLRIRWQVPSEAATAGWVYGLDNVELSLSGNVMTGDFNGNGLLDADDIDRLAQEIDAPLFDPGFDLTGDSVIDHVDLATWVHDIKRTWFGDANLDGEFNSGDLTQVFQAGTYELDAEAGWADGDWTGDHRFGSTDLVAAFQDGGYETGPRAAVSAVPEPSCAILLGIGVIGLCCIREVCDTWPRTSAIRDAIT